MATQEQLPALSIEAQSRAGELGSLPDIDPSKLIIQRAASLKPVPAPETLVFGQTMTDHMLEIDFNPESGWSAPVIKPYGPFTMEPSSSVFHYTPALFEGMKAFVGPDGQARLFRPNLNMARMKRSADRCALPEFDESALLVLIKELVKVDHRWIPPIPGFSLYIRPTLVGTRASLGVAASDHAKLFVILCPSGPYFPSGIRPLTLFAETDAVRSWPGGTGQYKLGINYTPTFKPQKEAAKKGYQQILWVLREHGGKEDDGIVTEVGQMNFFAVVERADGGLDVITAPLDGMILPGVTRASVLDLCEKLNTDANLQPFIESPKLISAGGQSVHSADALTAQTKDAEGVNVPPSGSSASSPSSPAVPLPSTESTTTTTPSRKLPTLHPREERLKLSDLERFNAAGTLRECFGSGTAATIISVGRIGIQRSKGVIEDVVLPEYEGGLGPVAGAMFRILTACYDGRVDVDGWSVVC